jgi:hypothetical protein
MTDKINKELHLSESMQNLKEKIRKHKLMRWKRIITAAFLGFMIIFGSYLLLEYRTYENTRVIRTYKGDSSADGSYKMFGDSVLKYTKDGMTLIDQKGKEIWNHSYQIKNPIIEINHEVAAIGDSGGNSIIVIDHEGIKGEIETTQPIEKLSISTNGIVAAVLKDEVSPKVMCYDSTGNILVENKVSAAKDGYPVEIALSNDGTTLIVSYLHVQSGALASNVVYYNFGDAGREEKNNQVAGESYTGQIVPSAFFMDDGTSVLVGESGFYIYEGTDKPKLKKEVKFDTEIKSVYHTEKYIGFVLKAKDKKGYEICLYNQKGQRTMSKKFQGDYAHVKMVGETAMMYDGVNCCIYTANGVKRFAGQFQDKILDIVPVGGINTYTVMNINGIQKVRLVK